MSAIAPDALARVLGEGLLTFPVTHFSDDLQFDEAGYRAHCALLLEHPFAGLFCAGGTGEFFSLHPSEVVSVTKAAVAQAAGKVPVISAAGYGTAMAIEMAKSAEASGADGLLLLPPYLVAPSQEGLAKHVSQICAATSLGVIVYARDNAVYSPQTLEKLCDNHRNLIGYKDGVGDIETFTAIRARLAERLVYIGGLPTAETFAAPYLRMGCTTYSSAIANFAPGFACEFYSAVRSGDTDRTQSMLEDFVLPYAAIRNRGAGYAVSIVKAALEIIGRSAGPVRPPLTGLNEKDFDDLATLIRSQSIAGDSASPKNARSDS